MITHNRARSRTRRLAALVGLGALVGTEAGRWLLGAVWSIATAPWVDDLLVVGALTWLVIFLATWGLRLGRAAAAEITALHEAAQALRSGGHEEEVGFASTLAEIHNLRELEGPRR